jgi:eukaryotic-like serine/threonine-protein kinase
MNEEQTIFSTPPSTPPEGPKERRFVALMKKPWFIVLVALTIVASVIAFSINSIMLTLLHSRPDVIVPKLEGKSLMEALSLVSPMDLSIQQEGTDFDESLPAGTILRQQPPSGMQVRAGRAIRVVISKGGQVVFVPDVVGKLLAEAQSLLATDGIQMGSVSESYSGDFAKNVVLSQSPSSATVVTRGAFVDVEVSKGPAPVGLPLLPDFFGKTAEQTREWADGVNATVKIKEDAKAIGVAGTVVKQDPAPGQPLLEGQDVMVTIVAGVPGSKSRFSYQMPFDSTEAVVRIMARNDQGETQVYEGKHKGGALLEVPVAVRTTTRFRVYVDDVLKEEKVVEP